jgi:regulatory protein
MTELDLEKKLYNYAIRLLARGEQTALQLTTKLSQKCLSLNQPQSPEIINNIILKLSEAGWLSEQRYVHAFARTKINQKMGPVKILYELSQKGLTEQQINHYIESCEAWHETNWVEQAVQVLSKKFSDGKPVIWPKKAKYLQSKGYTSEQIKRALKVSSSPRGAVDEFINLD